MTRRAPWLLLCSLLWNIAAPLASPAEAAPRRETSIASASGAGGQGEWLPRAAAAEELGRVLAHDSGQRLHARACRLPIAAVARGVLPRADVGRAPRWQVHPPRSCPACGWRRSAGDEPS